MIVGIEVGGTFTDLVMADGDGRLTVHKLPSTLLIRASLPSTGCNSSSPLVAMTQTASQNCFMARPLRQTRSSAPGCRDGFAHDKRFPGCL